MDKKVVNKQDSAIHSPEFYGEKQSEINDFGSPGDRLNRKKDGLSASKLEDANNSQLQSNFRNYEMEDRDKDDADEDEDKVDPLQEVCLPS